MKAGKMELSGAISIGIVCYRNWKYLYQTIDSVLAQDYSRIQLIVSDDGSDGFPMEEIKGYIEKNKKDNIISYLVRQSKQNEGTVKHINRVLDEVRGEYVIIMAGDDMLDNSNVFSRYAESFVDPENEGCAALVSQTAMYDENMREILGYFVYPNVIDAINHSEERDDLLKEVLYFCCIPTTSIMYRSDTFEKYGKFDPKYSLIEDYPYYIRLARAHAKMRYLNFVGARHRDGGISHGATEALSRSKRLYFNDIIKARKDILGYIDKYNVPWWEKSYNEYEMNEHRHTLITLGKGIPGKLHWMARNPKDFLWRVSRKYPIQGIKYMYLISLLLIFFSGVPSGWINALFSVFPITIDEIYYRIVIITILLFSLFFSFYVSLFRSYDDYPTELVSARHKAK